MSLQCSGVIFQFHLQCLGVVCKSHLHGWDARFIGSCPPWALVTCCSSAAFCKRFVQVCPISQKASETSGKPSQTSHAVFFPRSLNKLTASHHVIVWNTGSTADFWGPKVCAISCTAMYLNLCQVLSAIHNSSADISETAAPAMATTSVSTVQIRTSYNPLSVASHDMNRALGHLCGHIG